MSGNEVAVLTRAHQLFRTGVWSVPLDGGPHPRPDAPEPAGEHIDGRAANRYRRAVAAQHRAWASSAHTDGVAAGVLATARDDHARTRRQTGDVVAAARADTAAADTALAQREAMRRRAARLRAQHAHVQAALHRAASHRAALRRLRYRAGGGRAIRAGGRAGAAVRAALSRLGRPYVWGATGPNQFDCSGLTQWAYAQAGIHLDRTTYAQIHDGVPVPRSQIRPGDLVFPSTGHVQLAIGNNLVVEAPHAGAVVRISPLGGAVAIRRPVP